MQKIISRITNFYDDTVGPVPAYGKEVIADVERAIKEREQKKADKKTIKEAKKQVAKKAPKAKAKAKAPVKRDKDTGEAIVD